jgi:hypothetical protein
VLTREIDNYQGEESKIVIASLTRSNKKGDIGFMAAPERVNVPLSRARNVLIMVGNSKTFISSRKGEKCWRPLIDQLKTNRHIYDGLPVKCEQHPQTTAILKTKKISKPNVRTGVVRSHGIVSLRVFVFYWY